MMAADEKKDYWLVVRECLTVFHGVSKNKAMRMAVSLRREIESAEPEIKIDVFYHNEPFDVACDIMGHQIDMNEETFNIYKQILLGKSSQVH